MKWTAQEIAKVRSIVAVACEIAGKPAPSSEAFAIGWVDLIERRGITAQQVVEAVQDHMADPDRGRFAPKPADVLAAMRGGNPDERAAVAWSAVMDAVRRYGAGRSVVFDDPATMAAVARMGGWVELCRMTEADREPRWHTFRRIFAAIIGGGVSVEPPPVLRGMSADWDESRGELPAMVRTGLHQDQSALPSGARPALVGGSA